ncbi:MAG: hypothetical protein AMXMBFR61_26950 [Fimbriimonadales bacterium]
MTPTEQYIRALVSMSAGDRSLLRTVAGKGLDECVEGFDLFTGLWWPLRNQTQHVPRREVSWLVAKLVAAYTLPHQPGATLPKQLHACRPAQRPEQFDHRFDAILMLPLRDLEPHLRWALRVIASRGLSLDWVQLTDDLSVWEQRKTRLKWAHQFIAN